MLASVVHCNIGVPPVIDFSTVPMCDSTICCTFRERNAPLSVDQAVPCETHLKSQFRGANITDSHVALIATSLGSARGFCALTCNLYSTQWL